MAEQALRAVLKGECCTDRVEQRIIGSQGSAYDLAAETAKSSNEEETNQGEAQGHDSERGQSASHSLFHSVLLA